MSFRLPRKTEWMKEQMNHEPTRAYAEDMFNLAKKFPFKSGLEIGCMWGVSTLSLLLSNTKATLRSVDKSDYTHAFEETEANGVANRWNFVNMNSLDYWQRITDKFDLIYIDGDHRYEFASSDIKHAWEVLESGGILGVDDVLHKFNSGHATSPYGVSLAAWEFYHSNEVAEIGFVGKILYFKKP